MLGHLRVQMESVPREGHGAALLPAAQPGPRALGTNTQTCISLPPSAHSPHPCKNGWTLLAFPKSQEAFHFYPTLRRVLHRDQEGSLTGCECWLARELAVESQGPLAAPVLGPGLEVPPAIPTRTQARAGAVATTDWTPGRPPGKLGSAETYSSCGAQDKPCKEGPCL